MVTKRIYQDDQYAVTNTGVITGVREAGGRDEVACDASVFFPEGGGQPSDTGVLSCDAGVFAISHAYDESLEDDVWHVTDAPAGTFSIGDKVTLTIDWNNRFRNMQRHLGEHMLSGTFHTLYGGVNRGFHMGEEYITIDIDLDGRQLSEEELRKAERTVNDAIWADLPVTITWFDDYESSLALPVRKKVPHDGRVSVVTVGDAGAPYDCIACCGTHPARSSEVGLLSIYKCEPNKGMNRIYFDCGLAAWQKLTADSHTLADISKRYSCGPQDLAGRLELEAESTSALKAKLAAATAYIKAAEKSYIEDEIRALRAGSTETPADPSAASQSDQPTAADGPARATVYVYTSDLLGPDDLLKLGFSVINEISGQLLLMLHPESLTCILLSSAPEYKCGALVKEHAKEFGGRGGGRDDNARAIFTAAADLRAFADAICNL